MMSSGLSQSNSPSGIAQSPYGTEVDPEKAPEAITKAVASLPPEQMYELMKQMKVCDLTSGTELFVMELDCVCVQNNPSEARNMLLQNPQLAYALLQAQVIMKIVDPKVALNMVPGPGIPVPAAAPSTSNMAPYMPGPPPPQQPPPAPAMEPAMYPDARGGSSFEPPAGPRGPVPLGDRDMRQPPLMDRDLRQPPMGDRDMRVAPHMGDRDMRHSPMGDQDLRYMPRGGGDQYSDNRFSGNNFDPRMNPRPNNFQPQQRPPYEQQPRGVPPSRPPLGPRPPPQAPPPVQQQQQQPQQQSPGAPRPPMIPPTRPAAPLAAQDQEKAALIMQVLQLSEQQIAMLPPEQRHSIMILKDQIAKSSQQP
ncbi:CSTF2 [Cordylochernes scorpioides]|uniref:CSTF2 n=1 Tax=Cordylochernes scorpioides TaxID=51811 RepID=A0ABY6KJB5_9ARAC|nr:CSTF2 [Cordylochernes scorpioides]